MKWVSTRGNSPPVPFIDALFAGTAPDGGLYMPERLDPLPPGSLEAMRGSDIVGIGSSVLGHLLREEIGASELGDLVRDDIDFPVPLVQVTDRVWALELFHGPTLAFKDVGARVQARLLHHFTDGTPLTLLVATSGDTGSAVAQAFHRVPDTRVVVLYPEGKVSDVQEAHMASMGDNITALSVRGTFDDCQRLVKQAFADDELRKHVWLTPANSINLGRLLPQVCYYFVPMASGLIASGSAASGSVASGPSTSSGPPRAKSRGGFGRKILIAVPSGNFGNLTAGLIAKRIGLPVIRFVAATNVNDAVPVYLRSGKYEPRPSIPTVANAMDVGAPSNFERIQALYGHDLGALRQDLSGAAYTDERVVAEIGEVYRRYGYVLDPHGAIGWLAVNDALATAGPDVNGVFLATAHPAKFREVVEPAIGAPVTLPRVLKEALARPRNSISVPASYDALLKIVRP